MKPVCDTNSEPGLPVYLFDKNNMIYTREQEGLYQNKVTSSLISTCSCKMAY